MILCLTFERFATLHSLSLFLSLSPSLLSLQIVALKEIAVVHERRGADQEALKWFLQVNRIIKSIATTGNWSLRNNSLKKTVLIPYNDQLLTFPLPIPSPLYILPSTFFVIGNTVDWKDRAATAAADRT